MSLVVLYKFCCAVNIFFALFLVNPKKSTTFAPETMKNIVLMEKFLSKYLLLVTLLIGTASTCWADGPISCGEDTNLQYEIVGTTLVLSSPEPSKPATIVTEAFKGNTTITSVVIPSNVTTIEGQAFMGCTALANVDLGNVQSIGPYAFDSCFALTEIVIPLSVTSIGVHAFYYCSSLASVLCRPYTAPSLGTDAFTQCDSVLKICVSSLGVYGSAANWLGYYDSTDPQSSTLTVCFLDEYDEQSTAADKIRYFRTNGKTSIDIFRTLRKAGCFNTLTLPFSVAISGSPLDGDNVEVYEFAGAKVEAGTLQLNISKVTSGTLTAGKPYLIQWENTSEVLEHMRFTVITWDDNQTAEEAASTDVNYVGFYGKTHIAYDENHSNLFLAGNNTLYWAAQNDGSSMLGFRAYFHVNTGSQAPIHRGMPATLQIVSSSADVEATQAEQLAPRKELRNGQIVIIRNGETFLLNGQKL